MIKEVLELQQDNEILSEQKEKHCLLYQSVLGYLVMFFKTRRSKRSLNILFNTCIDTFNVS